MLVDGSPRWHPTATPNMTQRSPTEYKSAIRRVQKLHSTPQILSRALDLTRRHDVALERICELVKQDAALVADMIKLSNSALFGRGADCSDIGFATQRLGLREVLRAIQLSLSKNVFGKGLPRYGLTSTQYWRASVLAAILMEQLAMRHGVDAPEAYTIGILHGLGRVLINEVLDESKSEITWKRDTALERWEVFQVGFPQAEAACLLLRDWRFPPSIIKPIENQLGPATSVSAQSPTGMLRFVRMLLSQDPEASTEVAPMKMAPDVLGWAGFASEEEVAELLKEGQDQLSKVEQSLG